MDWSEALVGGLDAALLVALTALAAYVALVAMLRVSGKRTLSRMNAFDFVVTVALGSTLATTIVSQEVPWLHGALALAALLALQWAVAILARGSARFRQAVTARPATVARDGRLLEDAMARERLTPDDVWAAARNAGSAPQRDIAAVDLESDGELSVLGARWSEARMPNDGGLTGRS